MFGEALMCLGFWHDDAWCGFSLMLFLYDIDSGSFRSI